MRFFVLCLLVCLARLTGLAQEGPAPVGVALHFRLLLWEGAASGIFFEASPGKEEEVFLHEAQRSARYQFVAPPGQPIVLYRHGPPAAGQTVPSRVPVARLPTAGLAGEVLFVLARDPGAEERYRPLPLPEDQAAFPPGALRFVSLDGRRLGVLAAGQRRVLEARGSVMLAAGELGAPGTPFEISVYGETAEGGASELYSSRWMADYQRSTLVFLYTDPRSRELRVKRLFTQRTPPPAHPSGNAAASPRS